MKGYRSALSLCALVAVGLVSRFAHAGDAPVRFAEAGEIAEVLDSYSVLDLRPFADYLAGHIPGAVHMDDECLRGSRPGLPVQYCPAEHMARLFGDAGVSLERPVLVYSDKDDPLAATMAAYALARVGHSEISVLAGGYGAWSANHEVTREFPRFEPVRFAPGEPTLGAIEFGEFEESIGYDNMVFIDARPAAQYRGDEPIWTRNGHIPGAHSLDWKQVVFADNHHRLRSKKEIETLVDDLDISPYDDVVVYCGTGREATMLMIALSCELGWQGVRLYEGSWTEYSRINGAEIEVGKRRDPLTREYRDGRVGISGQPTKDTLETYADRGVRLVVSCRTDREMDRLDFDQAEELDELGIQYVHIPMGGHDGYTPEQVRRFGAALEQAGEGEVVLHCASGGRARLLWMAHLVTNEGLPPSEAWERSLELGGKPWSFERLLGREVRLEVESES